MAIGFQYTEIPVQGFDFQWNVDVFLFEVRPVIQCIGLERFLRCRIQMEVTMGQIFIEPFLRKADIDAVRHDKTDAVVDAAQYGAGEIKRKKRLNAGNQPGKILFCIAGQVFVDDFQEYLRIAAGKGGNRC